MAETASHLKRDGRASKSAHEVIESADFKELVKKRWTVSMILLALLFVSYYGFILLVATNKDVRQPRRSARSPRSRSRWASGRS